MPSLETDNRRQPVGVEEIIQGIQQLDDQALTHVAGELNKLLDKRKTQTPTQRERELVKKINAVIPASIRRRQKQLYQRLQSGIINQQEHEELLLLNQLLEEKSAERILLVTELAKLRGASASQLLASLKIV